VLKWTVWERGAILPSQIYAYFIFVSQQLEWTRSL